MISIKVTSPTSCGVVATLGIYGPSEVKVLLKAIEREIRERPEQEEIAILARMRQHLLGMRPRAVRDKWIGWVDQVSDP